MSVTPPAEGGASGAMPPSEAGTIFRTFLWLGLTGFGGPMAHLVMFRRAFVEQRGWISAERYDALVALAQLVPGPASSQVGFALGLHWAGWRGALAASIGFTLPSALLMTALGMGLTTSADPFVAAVVRGLMLVAVAVVAHAMAEMARTIGAQVLPLLAAAGIALVAMLASSGVAVWGALLAAAALGALLPSWIAVRRIDIAWPTGHRRASRIALAVLGALLVISVLPPSVGAFHWVNAMGATSAMAACPAFSVAAANLQAGALVFGGGHVVLPLLQQGVVEPGWVGSDAFASGYGAAQALPGPMFALSAYLGAAAQPGAFAPLSALLSLVAIFLPGFVFIVAAMAHAAALFSHPRGLAALAMVNGAVLGLLAAAWLSLVREVDPAPIDAPVLLAAVAMLFALRRGGLWAVLMCVGYALGDAALSTDGGALRS